MGKSFRSGDVVWAKMTSFPCWPGLVRHMEDVDDDEAKEDLGTESPTNSEIIYFFGSKNYAWIAASQISPFDENFEERASNKRAKTLKGFKNSLIEAKFWQKKKRFITEDELEEKLEKQKDNGKKNTKERKKKEEKEDDESDSRKNKRRRHSDAPKQRELSKKKDATKSDDETERTAKKRKTNDDDDEQQSKKTKNEKPKKENLITVQDKTQERMELISNAPKLDQDSITKALVLLAKHPVSKYHKLVFTNTEKGSATCTAFFSEARPSSHVEIHSIFGSVYFLLDVTCLAALMSEMHEKETAITQEINVTNLHPIPIGSEVTVKAKVNYIKPHTGLVFLEGQVYCKDKLMSTAKVIKSLIEPTDHQSVTKSETEEKDTSQ